MAQGVDAAITIQARDRATGQFRRVAEASNRLGSSWRILAQIVGRLNVGMIALTAALPLVGAALASVVTIGAAVSFLKFEQASRRARIQLQLLGFSASESRDRLRTLTQLMDRANASTFFQNAQAMLDVAIAGQALTDQLVPMASTFADLIGADPGDVFSALFDAFAKSDPDKFLRLVAGTERIAIPIAIITALEAGDPRPLMDWLVGALTNESLTNLEKLADNLERIGAIAAPAAEVISESTARIVNIFVASLAERAENLKNDLEKIFLSALLGAWIFSWESLGTDTKVDKPIGVVGKIWGRKLAGGLIGAFLAVMLLDLGPTIETLSSNPEVIATITLSATILGIATGKAWIAGIALLLGLELAPGIAEALEGVSTEAKVSLAALGVGTAIGLATKRGLLGSLALGSTLEIAASSLFEGETLEDKGVAAAYVALGAALGFAITKSWTGAFFGAAIASAIPNIFKENTRLRAVVLIAGATLAGLLVGGIPGALIGALIGAAVVIALDPVLQQTFINLGLIIGGWIANAMAAVVNNMIARFNRIPFLPNIPLIPIVPLPDLRPPKDFIDIIPPTPVSGPGMLPIAKPQPITVQLILDRKIIGQVAIDELGRISQFRAGLFPGSAGA